MMSMFDAPPPSNGASAPQASSSGGGMNDLMSGFEGLNFGGQQAGEPLPAAMQLQNAHGESGQQGQQGQKKDSDDLLGLL